MKKRWLGLYAVGLVLMGMITACTPAAAPEISIDSPWGAPSMSMPTAGAFYMLIKNTGAAADKLLSGSSPACGSIEVHESVMRSDGTMGMNLLDKPLEIAAGGQVELKKGGIHVMCIMKKDDQFKSGAKVDLTLKFEKAGEKKVTAEIRMQ